MIAWASRNATHLILGHAQRPLDALLLLAGEELLVRDGLEALAPPALVVLRRAPVVRLVQLADLGVPGRRVRLKVPDEDEQAGRGQVGRDLALGSVSQSVMGTDGRKGPRQGKGRVGGAGGTGDT